MLELSASKKKLDSKISTLRAVHLNFMAKSVQTPDLEGVSLETLWLITDHTKYLLNQGPLSKS